MILSDWKVYRRDLIYNSQFTKVTMSLTTARSHSPSRRDTSSSDVLLTEGYLNVPIPIDTSGSGAATLHTYLNANAAGTKFQPVGFNVNKVLGTLKKELKPYTLEETTLQLHEVIGKGRQWIAD